MMNASSMKMWHPIDNSKSFNSMNNVLEAYHHHLFSRLSNTGVQRFWIFGASFSAKFTAVGSQIKTRMAAM